MRFRFILARDLHMTVAELEGRLTSMEFSHWSALYQLEGEERERAAGEQ